MADAWTLTAESMHGPWKHAAAVTPADGADLTNFSAAIFVGGAGAIKVTTVGGETVTLTGVVAGTVLWLRVSRIFATGTTATNIAVFY